MKTYEYVICTCSNCNSDLVAGYRVNVYDGGPFSCSKCGADVTEDLYGKKKDKKKDSLTPQP